MVSFTINFKVMSIGSEHNIVKLLVGSMKCRDRDTTPLKINGSKWSSSVVEKGNITSTS